MGRLDQAENFLSIVSQNVARLKSLVEDLLDLSALESGKELQIERVSVREITEAVLSQVNAKGHKVEVSYGIEEMHGDPKRLEQVLRNLMENAVRYVPEGRSIDIRWFRGADQGIRLQVKDDGPGIAPAHQARLFERFYRVDKARTREQGGTGLGLAIVKNVVQAHGGDVRVESAPDKGTEFFITLPTAKRAT